MHDIVILRILGYYAILHNIAVCNIPLAVWHPKAYLERRGNGLSASQLPPSCRRKLQKTNSFKFITLQWIMREGDGKRNLSKSTVKARLRKPIVCDKNGCKKTDLAERCNRDKVGE